MKLKASRRRFLAAAGGSALALPFLRALPGYGQTETKRFLILAFCGNGVVRHTWGAEKLGPERGNIALHPSFQTALDPYKDYLTIVNGLRNKSADDIGGTHEGGMESLWTGGKGPSIDQIVGPTLGGVRPTLEFRVMTNEDETNRTRNNRMIFDGSGVPIDPREDAASAATQLFAGVGMADPPSNDHADLGFELHPLGDVGQQDRVTRADQRGGRLEKQDRHLGHFVAELPGMLQVIAADSDDLRWFEWHHTGAPIPCRAKKSSHLIRTWLQLPTTRSARGSPLSSRWP